MLSSDNASPTPSALQISDRNQKECMQCRIVGSGTLAGVGAYALYQTRSVAPGTPLGKKVVGGIGVALLIGSVIRWKQTATSDND